MIFIFFIFYLFKQRIVEIENWPQHKHNYNIKLNLFGKLYIFKL